MNASSAQEVKTMIQWRGIKVEHQDFVSQAIEELEDQD
jgi:predicted nucleic-acid-binding protein